jgi:uncharacterized protein HemY
MSHSVTGYVLIQFAGWRYESSAVFFFVALIVLMLAVCGLWRGGVRLRRWLGGVLKPSLKPSLKPDPKS